MSKNALVIGGDSLLGRELVVQLELDGYFVHKTQFLPVSNDSANTYQLDITNSDAVKLLVDKLPQLSFVSCMVAAPLTLKRFSATSVSEFDRDWNVNVRAQIDLYQQLTPKLTSNCNVIIVLSELTLDNAAQSFMHSYCVSKHALLGVMKTLAGELLAKGIFVNGISPGMMNTPLTEKLPSAIKTSYLSSHGRTTFIEPCDVAKKIIEITKLKTSGINYSYI